MLIIQANTPEEMRTEIIGLIRQTLIAERRELTNAPTKRAQAVSQGIVNRLHWLADVIAEARVEPRQEK